MMSLMTGISDVFSNPVSEMVIHQPLNSERDLLTVLTPRVEDALMDWVVWVLVDAKPSLSARTTGRAELLCKDHVRRDVAKRIVLRNVRRKRCEERGNHFEGAILTVAGEDLIDTVRSARDEESY